MKRFGAVVMAAGRGVRMRSPIPKVLMKMLGKPMVAFPVEMALELVDGPVVVVCGEFLDETRLALSPWVSSDRIRFAVQEQPRGTADAVSCGLAAVGQGEVESILILNGDIPAMPHSLTRELLDAYAGAGTELALVSCRQPDPTGYGRLIHDQHGNLTEIREHKELDPGQERIDLVNVGVYTVRYDTLSRFLGGVSLSSRQREYLLTDLVAEVAQRCKVAEVEAPVAAEVSGINNRAEFASLLALLRAKRNRELMESGVGMPHPDSVDVDFGVTVGADTTLEASVAIRGRCAIGAGCLVDRGSVLVDTTLADNVEVLPYCMLEGSVVHNGVHIGPFAHTRAGTVLMENSKVGNFVETKKTILGPGSKANHLTYLGDSTIGAKVNIGAGTITCNYDGYKKYQTILEDGVFIGSDTQLVAPVRVGKDAVVGAGTTVTKDVPAGALATSRVDQQHREGYSAAKRERMKKG